MTEEVAQNTATAEVVVQPLSSNAFIAFFQKIWRWWLGVWYGFEDKHPKVAKLIQQFVVMFLFSNLVTILQALIMIFLPLAFQAIWDVPFVWPAVQLPLTDGLGNPLYYALFNEPIKLLYNVMKDGKWEVVSMLASTPEEYNAIIAQFGSTYQAVEKGALIGDVLPSLQASGLGNFIAFEIATFVAQCINFPLQRNITFKSKGNPVVQGIWYFIGWVAISIGVNAIWGIMNPLMLSWNWNDVVISLIKTVLTGGVSMVIFFFIFLIIFPDQQKLADKAAKKVETLKANGASEEAIAAAELNATIKAEDARLDTARKNQLSAESLADAKAVSWDASAKALEKMKTQGKSEEDIAKQESIVAEKYQAALEAAQKRDEAIAENQAVIAEVETARAARA